MDNKKRDAVFLTHSVENKTVWCPGFTPGSA